MLTDLWKVREFRRIWLSNAEYIRFFVLILERSFYGVESHEIVLYTKGSDDDTDGTRVLELLDEISSPSQPRIVYELKLCDFISQRVVP